jgi:hypothetical protein
MKNRFISKDAHNPAAGKQKSSRFTVGCKKTGTERNIGE